MLSHNFLNSLKTKFKIFELPELLGSDEKLFKCNNNKINNFLNIVPNIFKKSTNPDTVIFAAQKF